MSLFFGRKPVDKWKNCPQSVDNLWKCGQKTSSSPQYQQGYPQRELVVM